jgi:flagellar basal body-associated protein FliL
MWTEMLSGWLDGVFKQIIIAILVIVVLVACVGFGIGYLVFH